MTKYVTKTESAPNNRSKRLLMSTFKKETQVNPSIDKLLTRLMSQASKLFFLLVIIQRINQFYLFSVLSF